MQVEFNPTKEVLFDRLLFSNVDDTTQRLLPTIVKKGTTFVASRSGVYTFCFDNRMAKWTAKNVTFDLDISDPNDASARAERAAQSDRENALITGADIDPKTSVVLMRAATNRLHAKLAQVENDQSFHYHREKRHRNTIESTTPPVMW